jgi:hypothetical protein
MLGQFLAYLGASALDAVAVPCCDNPTPQLPEWYARIATPVNFLVLLLPGFLCGFYVMSRPILVGALAALVGAFLWHWLGAHLIAQLFPARAFSGLGRFANALWVFYSPGYVAGLVVSSVCAAAAAAGAASGGYLFRNRVRPNHSLNRTVAG